MSAGRARLPAIDHLKAAAIVAVVFTHSGHLTFAGAETDWDLYLTSVWVKYHVPTFLFCSGFLYARSRRSGWRDVGVRLRRVLVPFLIASVLAQAAGLTAAQDLRGYLFELATASAMGIYYYVFVIACCIPLIWPLARMPVAGLWALCGGVTAYTLALFVEPGLRMTSSLLWGMRNPLDHFYLGFFLSGWLAALYLPRLQEIWRLAPGACAGAAGVAVAWAWLAFSGAVDAGWYMPNRILYTFAVIAGISMWARNREPHPVVLFLAEASLSIYLYHRIFQRLTEAATWSWPAPARIGTQVVIGLGGAALLALLGRRLLGEDRSRTLLGT